MVQVAVHGGYSFEMDNGQDRSSVVVDGFIGRVSRGGEDFGIVDGALAGRTGITDKGAKDAACVAEFAADMS
jgi:hypothetical protein